MGRSKANLNGKAILHSSEILPPHTRIFLPTTTSVSSSTPASFSDLLSFGVWGGPEEAYLPPADLEGALGGKVAGGGGGSSRRCGKAAGAPPAAGGWWTTGWSAEAAGASTGDELAREWQRGRIRRRDAAGDEEGGRGGGDSAISLA